LVRASRTRAFLTALSRLADRGWRGGRGLRPRHGPADPQPRSVSIPP